MNPEFKPIHDYTINLGTSLGEFKLYWDFNPEEGPSSIPSRVTLTWGSTTLDTGFRGSQEYNSILYDLGYSNVLGQASSGFLTLLKNQENPTTATVTLYTPIEESLAKLELICPSDNESDTDQPCLPNNSFFTLMSDTENCCDLPGSPGTKGFGETSNVVINGENYTITASGSGFVKKDFVNWFPNGPSNCSLLVGIGPDGGGPFSYTITFDKPINNVYFRWDLADRNEELIFETNSGNPEITSAFGVNNNALIEGNKITPADKTGLPGTGLQGTFKIHAPSPFTTLTVNGPGDCLPFP